MTPEQDKIYKEAVDFLGTRSQIIVAIEEMSELIKELTKWERGIGGTVGIAEEIADVEIMLAQLRYIFSKVGCMTNFNDLVDKYKHQKTMRLASMLEER